MSGRRGTSSKVPLVGIMGFELPFTSFDQLSSKLVLQYSLDIMLVHVTCWQLLIYANAGCRSSPRLGYVARRRLLVITFRRRWRRSGASYYPGWWHWARYEIR